MVFSWHVPGEEKLAHLEHRPPSEGYETRVSVPGECQERKYTHSTVRNGKEMVFFVTLRANNDVFLLFLCSQWDRNRGFVPVAHKIQLFLRADSKRVAQCICFREPLEGG